MKSNNLVRLVGTATSHATRQLTPGEDTTVVSLMLQGERGNQHVMLVLRDGVQAPEDGSVVTAYGQLLTFFGEGDKSLTIVYTTSILLEDSPLWVLSSTRWDDREKLPQASSHEIFSDTEKAREAYRESALKSFSSLSDPLSQGADETKIQNFGNQCIITCGHLSEVWELSSLTSEKTHLL